MWQGPSEAVISKIKQDEEGEVADMRGNGALETLGGKMKGCDSLPGFTTRDPKPITEAYVGGPITTQDGIGGVESEFGSDGKQG